MSTTPGLKESPSRWESPSAEPFDEAVWQTWLAKGRARERLGIATRAKAVKWISIMVLLASALLWSYLAPYEVGVRFVVAAGSVLVMFQAFHARRYALAVMFGALAVLYNPVAPMFHYSDDWKRFLLVASAFPFIASLASRNVRLAYK